MNPEIDLDSEIELPEVLQEQDEIKKSDKYSDAENLVINEIGINIFDQDLENTLQQLVTKHFNSLREKPAYSSDVFQIIELNNQLWAGFHSYEDYIQKNKITNVDINELNRLLRVVVLPKMNEELWGLTANQSQ